MELTDQMGRTVSIPANPQRIVSLVPSQTELLFDLGLGDRVVGITKFCIHPAEWFKTKTRIGGTKNFNFEVIHQLNPDLIIGNKEENYLEGIEVLAKNYPVWMSDIYTLADALAMITAIGSLTQTEAKAQELVNVIKLGFEALKPPAPRRALYLIWRNPFMAASSNTFIDAMLPYAGFTNVIADERYPELSAETIRALNPEYILLSSEPYPFKDKHMSELQTLVPDAKIRLVNGELFSWYGSRLQYAPAYFAKLVASG